VVGNSERLNPLDDPEGSVDFDFHESQECDLSPDLFDEFQVENTPLPHQVAFRQFVQQHRIDPAAFTNNSMFNYNVFETIGVQAVPHVIENVNVQAAEVLSTAPISIVSTQDTFSLTAMPEDAQRERADRLRSISPLILAHLNNGDISEQGLNTFLRRINNVQFQ
jgi:hypothetical protein